MTSVDILHTLKHFARTTALCNLHDLFFYFRCHGNGLNFFIYLWLTLSCEICLNVLCCLQTFKSIIPSCRFKNEHSKERGNDFVL